MNSVIIIPARYASTRYPGKPLVPLTGARGTTKPLIQRSYEAASKVAGVSAVFVATDDSRIAGACSAFGARVIITSGKCRNGTERCAEALSHLGGVDLVVNFQGDALLTPPSYVEALLQHVAKTQAAVATPAIRLLSAEVRELQSSEARGVVGGTSVVTTASGDALYFSKRLIPHLPADALAGQMSPIRLHIGIYAYVPQALRTYAATPQSGLERLEGLEQLRFLDLDVPVQVLEVERPGFALRELNNPEDVPIIEAALAASGLD